MFEVLALASFPVAGEDFAVGGDCDAEVVESEAAGEATCDFAHAAQGGVAGIGEDFVEAFFAGVVGAYDEDLESLVDEPAKCGKVPGEFA